MAEPIGIGVIGAGGAFGHFIAEAIEKMGEARIVAIAGRNPARLEKMGRERGVTNLYTDYKELIANPGVEVVAISTPPYLHAPMAIDAARAGKAIFLEKPAATTLDDAYTLLREVQRTGVPAIVDFVLRYNPLFDVLYDWTRRRLLGALHRVDFQNFAGDEFLPPDHWFWNREQSGGILVEHGVHFFDIYGHLIGAPPQEVRGLLTTRPGTDQQDKVMADVAYTGGAVGTYYHAFDKPACFERTRGMLAYDRGYIEVDGWIATSATIDALVDDEQRAALAAAPNVTLDTVATYEGDQQRMRGNGNAYRVTCRVRGTLQLPRSKQDVYRTSVADALRDLAALIRDPSHTPRVTLVDGIRAVAVAHAAAHPDEGVRIAGIWETIDRLAGNR